MGIITIICILLFVIVLIIFGGYYFSIFNSLARLDNNIDKAWSNIDVLLKQRHDELTKLMSTVKGYMKYEKGLLTRLTEARSVYMSARTVGEKAQADNMISGALKTLFAVSENYPDLKASKNFMQFQTRITDIENMIADRREFYNDSVNTYNIRIAQIPYVWIAKRMKYYKRELFSATAADKRDVDIDF